MITRSWPRALLHIDADAFFASVEQAINPSLKGKPVVTGKERNIVATASYEAKALGIKRGVALWDAKKMCPNLVILPTDYETVSIFSKRMFEIMRRYTPTVEEYSIDEAFLDITGLRRLHHASYRTIAMRIQNDIHRELGITVSVGLSVSKVLTKIASKINKPAGFMAISMRDIETVLKTIPTEEVWNIGPNTAELLRRHGMRTALEFAKQPRETVVRLLTKPGIEVWQELNGESIMPVTVGEKINYQSISKTKTFTPPSNEKSFVFAQLVKNIENACIKARRYNQSATKIVIFLKRADHKAFGLEAHIAKPSAFPLELISIAKQLFESLFITKTLYRATGVILCDLTTTELIQPTLFEDPNRIVKIKSVYSAIDELKEKYGKHAIHQASSLHAQKTQHLTSRGDVPIRKLNLLKGETKRRRLPLPFLQTDAR